MDDNDTGLVFVDGDGKEIGRYVRDACWGAGSGVGCGKCQECLRRDKKKETENGPLGR